MSFPEEPLNLSPAAGGPGYFPARIDQTLSNGKYKIIRKLGYGPRSSTWLVSGLSDGGTHAAQIFTVASSKRASKVEVPILEIVRRRDFPPKLPVIRDHFWETSHHGSHSCLIRNVHCGSIEALQLEENLPRLPIDGVQQAVYCAAGGLDRLHSLEIMHGAVNSGNICFRPFSDLEPSGPAPTSIEVEGFVTVLSQPLRVPHSFLPWRDSDVVRSDWPLELSNLGHAQRSTFKPEVGNNYSFAPETLLQNASCSPQTDIWMLGCMTFQLLTGQNPPFFLEETPARQLAVAQAFTQDEEIPSKWINDPVYQDMGRQVIDEPTKTLKALLSERLSETQASKPAVFIRDCLRLDPQRRPKSTEWLDYEWVAEAGACSCTYCLDKLRSKKDALYSMYSGSN